MAPSHLLVLLSLSISATGMSLYIRDMYRGRTKPNLVSFGLWTTAPLIGGLAALSAGADTWATLRILMSGFVPLVIFVSALWLPQAYWKLSLFDALCGIFSFCALCVWLFADSPVYAVLLAAIGDAAATLPTFIKAWKYPETETGLTYVFGFIATLVVFPAIPTFTIVNASFQIYLVVTNVLLCFAVYRKRLRKIVA